MRHLAAVDGSAESDEAVRRAARDATAFDATLEVVHVLTPRPELRDGEVVLPGESTALENGQRILDRAVEVARTAAAERDAGIEVEKTLRTGRPAPEIVDRAAETGADAVYLGHRGESARRPGAVGSVAKSVIDRADVPVTITR